MSYSWILISLKRTFSQFQKMHIGFYWPTIVEGYEDFQEMLEKHDGVKSSII